MPTRLPPLAIARLSSTAAQIVHCYHEPLTVIVLYSPVKGPSLVFRSLARPAPAKMSAPAPAPAAEKVIPMADVAKHTSKNDVWMVIDGKVRR